MTQAFHSRLKAPVHIAVHIASFCQRSTVRLCSYCSPPQSPPLLSANKGLYNFGRCLQKNAPAGLNEIILSPSVCDPVNNSALPGEETEGEIRKTERKRKRNKSQRWPSPPPPPPPTTPPLKICKATLRVSDNRNIHKRGRDVMSSPLISTVLPSPPRWPNQRPTPPPER